MLGVVSACARMYVLSSWTFTLGSEEREEDVSAGCIYQSAEFAVTCAARCVCTGHVFCVCLWGTVLSPATRPDLGVGSWGCGASVGLLDSTATTEGL